MSTDQLIRQIHESQLEQKTSIAVMSTNVEHLKEAVDKDLKHLTEKVDHNTDQISEIRKKIKPSRPPAPITQTNILSKWVLPLIIGGVVGAGALAIALWEGFFR